MSGSTPGAMPAGVADGVADGMADSVAGAHLEREYDNMLACVRCGLCLTSCPTYVLSLHEAEGPRGRVAMARALTEGHLTLTADLIQHEQSCLICDACSAVCPAGVEMDPLQVALRAAIEAQLRRPWRQRALRSVVFRLLFRHMAVLRLVVRLLGLYQALGVQWLARRLGILQALGLASADAFLPPIPRRLLVPRGEVYPAERSPTEPAPRVALFAGCVMSTALAELDCATIRVLQRAGCDVVNTAGQGCCGALNAHEGDLDGMKELARRNIRAFERDPGAPIIVNSAGCGAMLKDYARHFRDDPEWVARASAFSARVRDVTEFLTGRALPIQQALPVTATFQDPCHLAHAQGITQQPRALLKAIPELEVREMRESALCCGSAGIYNLTHPAESRKLQQRKLDQALATGAAMIVTANPGCLLQLRAGLAERRSPVQVKHIIEVLDMATAPPPRHRQNGATAQPARSAQASPRHSGKKGQEGPS
jgi:glycolate oxidase iron-sulfur subunit